MKTCPVLSQVSSSLPKFAAFSVEANLDLIAQALCEGLTRTAQPIPGIIAGILGCGAYPRGIILMKSMSEVSDFLRLINPQLS